MTDGDHLMNSFLHDDREFSMTYCLAMRMQAGLVFGSVGLFTTRPGSRCRRESERCELLV
jgi:hypothetical protein